MQYALATRFIPSRSGVTRPIRATRNSPASYVDLVGQQAKKYPKAQTRACNAAELNQCAKTCEQRGGIKQCERTEYWTLQRLRDENGKVFTLEGWKDAPNLGCLCNDDDPDPYPPTPPVLKQSPNSCSGKNCKSVVVPMRDVITGVIIFTVVVMCEVVL